MNTKTTNSNFGENLRNIREKSGYTQAKLADISGISKRMIGHYETQVKRPSVDKLKKLADALKISIDDIIGNSVTKNKNSGDTSYRIMKRVRIIEKLPKREQDMIFSMINTFAEKHGIKNK